ncbi:GNAT family N-acetyltransferase [Pilimelia anulata]|uniref:GNAT family N-acetyltransferase n=1 Tax=Pilimelia anulata TaxID=53371 RepID=UPI001E34E17F|nr:GNAT family N-acetyltransferase [Pilimelia anulata]
MSELTVRPIEPDELAAAWDLGRLAFGGEPADEPPAAALATPDWLTRYGAFTPDGTLVGRAIDLHDTQWWGGRTLAAADVAGVAVAPEWRGRGVARALLAALLAGARERGAAVSALFPTVVEPYAAAGWAVCGTRREYALPAAALPRYRPEPGLTLRAGTDADVPATADLYGRLVAHRTGLLARAGGRFGDPPATAGTDGLTLVERDGELCAYAYWDRGRGYAADATLTVEDPVAADPAAARALLGALAGWRSVTPTLRIAPLAYDALGPLLPWPAMREHAAQPWMHRPVDAARAVAARGWPPHAGGAVTFTLADPLCPWNDGHWRLTVADGRGTLEPAAGADLRLTPGGFAQLYCGVTTGRSLVAAGSAAAAGGADPATLDLLACGEPAQLSDYF